jgi:putative ABC transport system permease protein
MNPLQTSRVAIRALFRNKTRSFLTMLGVIIGVAAVIAMVALGEGAKSQVQSAFSSLGTNLLVILPGSHTSGGAHGGAGSQPTLTWDDLKAIQTEVPYVKAAAPMLRTSGQVVVEEQNWSTSIVGTTPAYFEIRSWHMAKGRVFNEGELEGGIRSAVLGQTVATQLFGPDSDPIGKFVRIKNVPFEVVGLLESKGQSGMGQDADDSVFVPVTTYQARIEGGLRNYIMGPIMVGIRSESEAGRAQDSLSNLLRERHRIAEDADDDFTIANMAEIASAFQQSIGTLTTLLASIAIVSLIVGGIGIMNIMLVSVTERTREIGIRMAIGATPAHIRAQFLVEALVLSLSGGGLGLLLGVFAAYRLASGFGWPVLVRTDIVVIALVFSSLVGVVFGFYPAHKASRLDPIEALRYE